MITHIVIFFWIDGVTSEQTETFRSALDKMTSEIQAITVIRHGPDLRFLDGNGDYGLIATFSDKEAWDTYQAHPKHRAFIRDFVTPIQASRITIQL